MTSRESMNLQRLQSATVLALALALLSCNSDGRCVGSNPLMPTCADADDYRIAFVSNMDRPGRDDQLDLYTMNSRGTDIRRLTTHGRVPVIGRWSPDGTKLVYSESGADPATPLANLVVISADGSNPRNISNGIVASDGYPAWSPDGRRIVFHSNRHNTLIARTSIYVMDVDGSNVLRLTTNNAWNDRTPHWSPDGSKIAFMSNRSGGVMQIFLMNPDGTDQQQLTTTGTNQWPNWSPDGTKISFSSTRSTNGTPDNGIYIMNPDGSGQTNVSHAMNMADMHNTWSPDGREIYFCSTRAGMHVQRVTVATGVVRQMTETGGMSMEASPNATWRRASPAAAR
jgi:TolB protein